MKVFLGGTCNDSPWRDEIIPMLEAEEIEYFNPVVPDWTPEHQAEEVRQRELCDFCLYTITPRMTGSYAIAEAVDDSNKRPKRTILCVLARDGDMVFTPGQLRSLNAVAAMVRRNGGHACETLEECVEVVSIEQMHEALMSMKV
jgi:hypothetical protein